MRIVADTDNHLLRNQRGSQRGSQPNPARRPFTLDPSRSRGDTRVDFDVMKDDAHTGNVEAGQDEMSARLARLTLLALIDQLPICHREVLLIVDVHGYDYAEAMQRLALPMGTIKSHLCQARVALRDGLVAARLMTR